MKNEKIINGEKYILLKRNYWKDDAKKQAKRFKKSAETKARKNLSVRVIKGKWHGDTVWGIYYFDKK